MPIEGGSWIVPTDAIVAGDWARITQLAREATQLPREVNPALLGKNRLQSF